MAAIATWTFGQQAVDAASVSLREKGSCIDAVQKGINGKVNLQQLSFSLQFICVNVFRALFPLHCILVLKENEQLLEGML